MSALPLAGVTVVAFEQAVAAPFATRQLADLGARVIKIERDTGDFARQYDRSVNGMASYFAWLNRGKESVVLDLKTEAGVAAARALIADADVVVQNLAPGAADRLGIGPTASRDGHADLIYASISGYGDGGPYAKKKAYDLLIQCEAGLLSVTGTPEDPAKVGISIADIAAGMYAYTGVLTALLTRARTGVGDTVDVSMLDALGEWMMQPYLYAQYGGTQAPRSGAEHATIAPYGPFPTATGAVFLAVQNDREWATFARAVLHDDALAADVRFASNTDRVQNRDALHTCITAALASLSADDVEATLDDAGIANARVRDMAGLAQHPQLLARNKWQLVDSPVGPVRSLTPPVIFGGFEQRLGPIPDLGADTAAVLSPLRTPVAQ
jgi:itaconate CoA-transferase